MMKLTDETKVNDAGETLHRVVNERGTLGGWVGKNVYFSEDAWVEGNAEVYGHAYLYDSAWVYDYAKVYGHASIADTSRVSGGAHVFGDAHVWQDSRVGERARVYGEALVTESSRIGGDAHVYGNVYIVDSLVTDSARVYGEALVCGSRIFGAVEIRGGSNLQHSKVSGSAVVGGTFTASDVLIGGKSYLMAPEDILSVGPIGSESSRATLTRTRDGHELSVGCWGGRTVDELAGEVARRRDEEWLYPPAQEDHWVAQYEAFEKLARVYIEGWK